jgi:hypothetical protein
MADDLDEDPSASSVRTAVGVIMIILAIVIMIFVFFQQNITIRAVEFGCALVLFVLSIVQIVI